MKTRAFLVSLGLLAVSFGPALADNVSATVDGWDATTRTLTLDDKSQFADIPKEVAVPDLKAGDRVTVDYYADEDGIQAINAITVNRDIAKRLLPQTQKGG
jgi:hypothetical protein